MSINQIRRFWPSHMHNKALTIKTRRPTLYSRQESIISIILCHLARLWVTILLIEKSRVRRLKTCEPLISLVS
jgi:hypothetical protein